MTWLLSLPGWIRWAVPVVLGLLLAGWIGWAVMTMRGLRADLRTAEQGRALALDAAATERQTAAIERERMAGDLSALRRRAVAADAARLLYQSIIEEIDHVQSDALFDPALLPVRQRLRERLMRAGDQD